MAINMNNVPGQWPTGLCPSTWQETLNNIAKYLQIQVPEQLGFGLFSFGSSTPSVDRQEFPWFQTNTDGTPYDINVFTGGDWVGFGFSRPPSQSVFDARLTLSTGVALPTGDVTGTSIYLTPYNGNVITLYNGSTWVQYPLETDAALSTSTLLASTNYDVFVSYNGTAFVLATVAWTNATTRATALASQNGVYVKSGDSTSRYVGSIRTTATPGQVADTATQRFVWNYLNRAPRAMIKEVAASGSPTWAYATATFRYANNDSTNVLGAIHGIADVVDFTYACRESGSGLIGIGVDTAGATPYYGTPMYNSAAGGTNFLTVRLHAQMVEGYHAYAALEAANGATTFGAISTAPNETVFRGVVSA